MVRMFKRAQHGARWDEAADAELRQRFEAGQLLPQVAKAMNRSQEAVRTRANVLHIPVRSTPRRGTAGMSLDASRPLAEISQSLNFAAPASHGVQNQAAGQADDAEQYQSG